MLKPYQSFDGIEFEADEATIIKSLGAPISQRINDLGYKELEYAEGYYRLQENALKEMTLDLRIVPMPQQKVYFVSLKRFIHKNDDGCFERSGFYVSPKLGIAFDPYFPSWVTIFSKTELPQWRKD
jgi:hypothetical protein